MNCLVSIIVPVYNVSKYLNDCFQSLSNQTYSNIEIIIVDDGSTDGSLDICVAWSKKDGRFKVFHQSNRGVNSARYFALKQSSGEFVMFCDSDDLFDEFAVETAIRLLKNNRTDLVVFNAVQSDGVAFWGSTWPSCSSITAEKSLGLLLSGAIRWNIWLICAKRNLFEHIYIPTDIILGEDLVIFYQLLGSASTVTITDKPLYKYMIREGSASETDEYVPMVKQEKNQKDILRVLHMLQKYVSDKYPSQVSLCNLFLFRRSYSSIRAISCMKNKSNQLLETRDEYLYFLKSIYKNIYRPTWKDILKMMMIRIGIIKVRWFAGRLPE